MKRTAAWAGIVLLPVVIDGGIWLLKRNPAAANLAWPAQMAESPAYASQSPNPVLPRSMTAQPAVPGTIARGFQPFHYGPGADEAARAGRELKNPLEPTPGNLARGRQVFTNYCTVCHGPSGAGDGPLIPKCPNPPSFNTEQSRNQPDGTLFHVIALGRNNMPAHAPLVSAEDRWKALLYIRQLQGKIR